jgi:SAM-dependent methyltransferase
MRAGVGVSSLSEGAGLYFKGMNCLPMLDFAIQDELEAHEKNLTTSNFKTNRSLTCTPPHFMTEWVSSRQCYETAFNSKFIKDITALKPDQHWVDLGAGEALAMMEYLILKGNQAAHTTAINYQAPANYVYRWSNFNDNLIKKHRMLQGEDFLEMNAGAIGAADIITDVFGVMAYTPAFDVALSKVLELLKPSGRFYMVLTSSSFESQPSLGYFDITQYLDLIAGIRYEMVNHSSVLIYKTGEPIRIPSLKLLGFEAHTPPTRHYRIIKDQVIQVRSVSP